MTARRVWVPVTALLLVWALSTAVTGGFFIEWGGVRVSSRDPWRPLIAAALVIALARWRYGFNGVREDLAAWSRIDLDRWSPALAAVLSAIVLVVGLVWCTRIAGGADSYGYVSQSRLWVEGNLIVHQPIATKVPWRDADWTLAPLGYRPAPTPGSIVPSYAPGLPMLMALFSLVHPDGVFWVVPLTGAAVVALSFMLGRTLGGSAAGLIAALLMATSPAFLFQLVAPMSDVPIAAFWIAALVLALPNRRDRWLAAGLASSIAILVRPNTVPLAAAFVLAALWNREPVTFKDRFMNAFTYATGCVPGVLSVVAIHTALYGSPLESGYGSVSILYNTAYLLPNLARYPKWLVTSETPFVCLALAVPFLSSRSAHARWQLTFTGLVAATMWACYILYQPWEPWWYLRFLLTSFPCLLALSALSFVRLLSSLALTWRIVLAVAVLVPVVAWRVDYAIAEHTLDSWRLERRYADTGHFVRSKLPENAILFSGQQSGSLRYYSGRLTLVWGYLDRAWLERAIDALKGLGLQPYLVAEDGEERDFRSHFQQSGSLGRLDWEPLVELKGAPVVRIYKLDRTQP